MIMGRPLAIFCLITVMVSSAPAQPNKRDLQVRGDKQKVEAFGFWIYNDLPRGIEEAKKSGKPLLVTLRCVPCEQCAQLDEQVVERDPTVRSLMEKFICVRIVQANGLDLSLFQYDYDQSWAAFMLNADLTIYGRYGTRSHQRKTEDDVSLESFGKALEGALALHAEYPKNKAALAGKHGPAADVRSPEEYPTLRARYKSQLDYSGQVAQSCIHCHMVGEAQRAVSRTASGEIPDKLLHPYPNPKTLGLILDPKEKATVKSVVPGSSAEKDGFRAGDAIVTLEGQPLLSIADVQWVLHNAGEPAALKAEVKRNGQVMPRTITLAKRWREHDDLSWRASSWDLRRMTTGGMLLEELSAEDRQKAGIAETKLALRAKHVGAFGAHAAAKQAGFLVGDVLVTVDGKSDRRSESDLMATLAKEKRPGDKVPVTVLRGGQMVELTLPMQ
jgi:serine protease Do